MPLRRSPAPERPTEARPTDTRLDAPRLDPPRPEATVHRARRRVRSLVVLAATLAFAGGIALALAIVAAGGPPDGAATPAWPIVVALSVPIALISGVALLGRAAGRAIPSGFAETGWPTWPTSLGAPIDPLTALPGHRSFQEDLEALLAPGAGTGSVAGAPRAEPLALVLIDIDDFKRVNDSGGHAAGDDLLVELAHLLVRGLRAGDRAYRIGGDEFALILPGLDGEAAGAVVRRILATCLNERAEGTFLAEFSFSAGVAATARRSVGRETLYGHADGALAQAKRDGRCVVRVWEGGDEDEDLSRRVRSAAILEVLDVGGLRPMYQPFVDLASGKVIAYEGLVRPPKDSMFRDPSALFHAAEEAGRTVALDLACIAAILGGAKQISPDQSISLNLSPRTLEAPEFAAAAFVRRLSLARWAPERVIVELTERERVEDLDRVRRVLTDLRSHGIRVAADDVGAGNAGLRLLSQIHFDIVKLDLSLVQGGLHRDTTLAVVRSIADLAARWGAIVVAEGVETPEQLRLIRQLGLSAGQGFLLGPPRPTPEVQWVDLDGLESLADDEPVVSPALGTATA
jgi:diguanylate cyclase (GGDEF)-like protein